MKATRKRKKKEIEKYIALKKSKKVVKTTEVKLSSTTTSKHFLIWRNQIYSKERIKWHRNKNEEKKQSYRRLG